MIFFWCVLNKNWYFTSLNPNSSCHVRIFFKKKKKKKTLKLIAALYIHLLVFSLIPYFIEC
jgi:hypothetical protein